MNWKNALSWILTPILNWTWGKILDWWKRHREVVAERREFKTKVQAAEAKVKEAQTPEEIEKAYAELLALHRSRSSK